MALLSPTSQSPLTLPLATHNGQIKVTLNGKARFFRVKTVQEIRVVEWQTNKKKWLPLGKLDEQGQVVLSGWKSRDKDAISRARLLNEPQRFVEMGGTITFTGKCRVCNRPLTNPKSVAAGIGPDCAEKLVMRAAALAGAREPLPTASAPVPSTPTLVAPVAAPAPVASVAKEKAARAAANGAFYRAPEGDWLVNSESEEIFHCVEHQGRYCSCKGYKYHKKCWHVDTAVILSKAEQRVSQAYEIGGQSALMSLIETAQQKARQAQSTFHAHCFQALTNTAQNFHDPLAGDFSQQRIYATG